MLVLRQKCTFDHTTYNIFRVTAPLETSALTDPRVEVLELPMII